MQNVGIKALKADLSKYVAKVREGERIVVTDRGREVAELIPLSQERKVVKSMVETGKLKWAGGKPTGLKGVAAKGKTVAETIIENRR